MATLKTFVQNGVAVQVQVVFFPCLPRWNRLDQAVSIVNPSAFEVRRLAYQVEMAPNFYELVRCGLPSCLRNEVS